VINFNEDLFSQTKQLKIPDSSRIIFVSDLFVEDYVGGAELTSESLITSSPFEVYKLHSKDVTLELLQQGLDRFWIFGNFTQINHELIPSIIGNLKYSILEYDYKYCKARSPEKHFDLLKSPCDCHDQINGKIISAFFHGSMHLWWMSEKQKERYHKLFPFLIENNNTVLSSVFDTKTLQYIQSLREQTNHSQRKGWIVLGGDSWIKGSQAAKTWCEENKKDYEIVWNLPYQELLKKLATAEGLVYLPLGSDTCPRLTIEAKLLGCKLVINENVQHSTEEWFSNPNITDIEEYLATASKTFWNGIKIAMDYKPTISGYTTTYNCVSQEYPFKQSIQSMLQFCDEVCVVDGGSNDGTIERLAWLAYPEIGSTELHEATSRIITCMIMDLAAEARCSPTPFDFPQTLGLLKKDARINVRVINRDWNDSKSAVFDGQQKAEARKLCTKDFCWQMDTDEIVHEDDAKKILDLCRVLPKQIDVLSLPVIEYWGSAEKVRCDVMPWKWRLSRNKPFITHGIPSELRRYDSENKLYAASGTDGCDMINNETFERIPHVSFYTDDIENIRKVAILGNENARLQYENWFNQAISSLPCVFHYSWFDIERKIKLYRSFWTRHWISLVGEEYKDTPEQNMMFDCSWSEVTDEMIKTKAQELATKTGGHIWHRKWNGEMTPSIKCSRKQPLSMIG